MQSAGWKKQTNKKTKKKQKNKNKKKKKKKNKQKKQKQKPLQGSAYITAVINFTITNNHHD